MAADMYVRHGLFEQAVRLTREVLSLLALLVQMYVRHGLFEQAVRLTREVLSLLALLVQKYKYRHLARRLLRGGFGRMPWYADVCWRILTYADVC
jgi:hypothetical protein